MPSISANDTSIRLALKQHVQANGAINEEGVKAIAMAAGDGGVITKTERKDLEKLLGAAGLEPRARKLLQDFLASPQANAPAPTHVPLAQRTNPAFAFFGMQNTGPVTPPAGNNGTTQGSDGVQGTTPTPEPQRPRTLPPPAVIASSLQSVQVTGPEAKELVLPADALVQMWAVPGSTIRIYNNSVLENGRPKLLKEIVAPMTSNDTGPRCMASAYPTVQEFNRDAATFMATQHDGMVLVSVPLTPADNQDVRDTLKVTMQTGSRAESAPVFVKMHNYTNEASPRLDRLPNVDTTRLTLNNGVLTTQGDFAMTPGTHVVAMKDGLATNISATADENGHLTLDLSTLGTSPNVVLVTGAYKVLPGGYSTNTIVPLDLSAQGLAAGMPTVQDRLVHMDNAVVRGFMQAPVGGKIHFEVPGMVDGAALEIRNPANPSQVYVFVAGGGKLVVDLPDACEGDALKVNLDLSRVQDPFKNQCVNDRNAQQLCMQGSDGRGRFSALSTFVVPTAAQAARAQQVLDAFPNERAQRLGLALDLFGPYARVTGGQLVNDPARMRDIVEGALVGSSLPNHWVRSVQTNVQAHGTQGQKEGFELGLAWAKATGASLAQDLEQAGFEVVRDNPYARASTTVHMKGLPDVTNLDRSSGYESYVDGPSVRQRQEARAMDNPRGASFAFTLPA
jgi:hypothetical protein